MTINDKNTTNGSTNETACTNFTHAMPKLTVPKFTGKYEYIKSCIELLCPSLQKVMDGNSVAMFKMICKICECEESLLCFKGKYINKFDINKKGKSKPFTTSSLRAKQPLNHSKKVKNDSRCEILYTLIEAVMGKAHQIHEEYKKQMSKLAKQMGNLELKAYIELLGHQYNSFIFQLAHGLTIFGKLETKKPTPKNSIK
jgi:hypothetical protein